ncbi:bifunctional metallophosphatase/5'-nucleotidase [Sphingobacterium sp. SGR-19]|uniref:bifunctional metallophosphatase/5'-nucleotidase n=1 Tax=Sphingobacterium sp. SGR-19 TaxID=2710886 RepID=UPI0013EA57F5|nr:metallophosphatase [Sphingobacterium sp. SGR-19]NGM66985.1 bifunctional metallophosphatase/5'-nucleotidase [Sphingobacterium sp. SGR-19]
MEEFKSLNRRSFIRQSLTLGAMATFGAFPIQAVTASKTKRLTILHTNDVHSRIDPFPMDGSRNQGLGGVARRSTLIDKIRRTEKNVLLVDSGDMFQGTPYFNMFGGKLELELMSKLGYEAGTFGNHEFDNGMESLAEQLHYANFPFLTANYDFSGTPLAGHTKEYIIIEKGGIRIGLTGVGIDVTGLVDPNNHKGMTYLDPVPVVNRIAKMLKENKKCDLVICLSHLGYKYNDDKIDDLKLAARSRHLDIILGGHTHTFLNEPTRVSDLDGKEVWINQMGFAGIRLGRLDVVFNQATGAKNIMALHYTVDMNESQLV